MDIINDTTHTNLEKVHKFFFTVNLKIIRSIAKCDQYLTNQEDSVLLFKLTNW